MGRTIHAYPPLEHRSIQTCLRRLIAQHGQDIGEAIIGAIGATQAAIEQGGEGRGALRHPVPHGHQAMVALGQEVAEPNAHHGADTGALPGPMGCNMGINDVTDVHLLDDAEKEGHIVDLFRIEEDSRARLIPRRWYDKSHGMCGNLLIGLIKHPAIPCCGVSSDHATTSCLNWGINLRES